MAFEWTRRMSAIVALYRCCGVLGLHIGGLHAEQLLGGRVDRLALRGRHDQRSDDALLFDLREVDILVVEGDRAREAQIEPVVLHRLQLPHRAEQRSRIVDSTGDRHFFLSFRVS
jgi:hypothetical protein